MGKYLTKVTDKEKAVDYRKFIKSRDEWISQHNRNPGKTKLQSKTDLKAAQETLETTESIGGEFIAPEREFVFESDWDASDGEWDDSKATCETIFGVQRKGMWKQVGKKGHTKFR